MVSSAGRPHTMGVLTSMDICFVGTIEGIHAAEANAKCGIRSGVGITFGTQNAVTSSIQSEIAI
jgi:hypothetical protein